MRIVPALIAVLGLTAVVRPSVANEYFNETYIESRTRFPRRIQKKFEEVECCPSIQEMVEPIGGKNQEGMYVELYRDQNYRQRFYELSCPKEVLDKPCKFINKKLHNVSRCVQQYSDTYALVKDTPIHRNKNFPMFPTSNGESTYTLDYIRIRSGCSCVVKNSRRKRNRKKTVRED